MEAKGQWPDPRVKRNGRVAPAVLHPGWYPPGYQQLPESVVLVVVPEVCLPVLSMFMMVQPVSLL